MKKSTGGGEEGDRHGAVAVHSQVIRIKQEIEKWKEPSPEIRRLRLRDIKRQRSRSPLGVAERAILVGVCVLEFLVTAFVSVFSFEKFWFEDFMLTNEPLGGISVSGSELSFQHHYLFSSSCFL
ncbi:hypothetical protein K1719_028133 [Acacia pycnantha]|nr:hypothetical protein K1719_028133 [Acacia pycnantha]